MPPTPLLGGWAEGGWCGACLIDDYEDDGNDHDEHDEEDEDDEVIAVVWAHCGHT